MKLCLFADPHLGRKDLDREKQALRALFEAAIEKGAETFICLGDLFDRAQIGGRRYSTAEVVTAARWAMQPFLWSPSIIVPGNHEYSGGHLNAARVFGKQEAHIIDRIQTLTMGDVCLVIVPWTARGHALAQLGAQKGQEAFDEAVKAMLGSLLPDVLAAREKDKKVCLVGHFDIAGAQVNTGRMLVGGRFEIPTSLLSDLAADVVAIGHIHKRQEIRVFANH